MCLCVLDLIRIGGLCVCVIGALLDFKVYHDRILSWKLELNFISQSTTSSTVTLTLLVKCSLDLFCI